MRGLPAPSRTRTAPAAASVCFAFAPVMFLVLLEGQRDLRALGDVNARQRGREDDVHLDVQLLALLQGGEQAAGRLKAEVVDAGSRNRQLALVEGRRRSRRALAGLAAEPP